jgi:hypothetical protein
MKNFYLARRHLELWATPFTYRWWRHCELAMGPPLWRFARGYEHRDVLAPSPSVSGSGASRLVWSGGWDGVGIVYIEASTFVVTNEVLMARRRVAS